jgi:hypothetical protein
LYEFVVAVIWDVFRGYFLSFISHCAILTFVCLQIGCSLEEKAQSLIKAGRGRASVLVLALSHLIDAADAYHKDRCLQSNIVLDLDLYACYHAVSMQ